MTQEYLILDNGGLMTPATLKQHNSTIKHYNRLVDILRMKKAGTTEYLNIAFKLIHLQAYIDSDLKKAHEIAVKIKKT